MAWTVNASGTILAAVGTEQTLAATTNNATFLLRVNVVNMAAGDCLRLRLYTQVLSSDALAVIYEGNFAGAADATSVILQSISVVSDQGVKATMQQLAGTGRLYAWSLLQI